jgi:hypothetical protein
MQYCPVEVGGHRNRNGLQRTSWKNLIVFDRFEIQVVSTPFASQTRPLNRTVLPTMDESF